MFYLQACAQAFTDQHAKGVLGLFLKNQALNGMVLNGRKAPGFERVEGSSWQKVLFHSCAF
ncbi:hypothetical protein TH63_18540 [Rufibacter radiotolerans]|uniref:Uncharacterized protein n=1 Tax=Rufibacter radiotolerans TaxID=1379910 RepID=A0A0H4VTQ4_9BACT|nr:hypothetical protein TH63_18540 [Rufibacter radiotolerans]